jgi:hypothetical protein
MQTFEHMQTFAHFLHRHAAAFTPRKRQKLLFAATCLLQLRRQFVAQPCVSYLLHRNEAGFFAECCGRF